MFTDHFKVGDNVGIVSFVRMRDDYGDVVDYEDMTQGEILEMPTDTSPILVLKMHNGTIAININHHSYAYIHKVGK